MDGAMMNTDVTHRIPLLEEHRKEILEFAIDLVRRAGTIVLDYFHTGIDIQTKSTEIDLVTEADLASERFIKETLKTQYPNHDILAEEMEDERSESEFLWVVDPLDGTVNFAHGFPIFSITMALYHKGTAVLGVTYDPLREEVFSAEKDGGAFLNGQALRVSTAPVLVQSLVATGFPYTRATVPDNNLVEFNRVLPKVQGVRRGGSAALDMAYVAAGRLDGYWEAHLSPWDWAAGVLMIEEAGGRVTDRTGKPWRFGSDTLVATNGLIHQELQSILSGE
jgi:myo-inositol-1(or 4)-monophosphatase